jgi:3,4-dihydroxy-2-butanone 4-phosphate synthase
VRSGHTEAARRSLQALRAAAGRRHLELMNDDGTVMKGEQVARFAATYAQARHDC